MPHPVVSLVMKVYNGEKYLRGAIDSILNQTFRDFELLIIDDGSRDRSAEIVRSYPDTRIRFFENGKNLGLCETQNRVIRQAAGVYIAVMDCDDISYPERFAKQTAFLDAHPDIMMCGCQRDNLIDGKTAPFGEILRLTPETLRFSLLFGNYYFTHSSIMFRADEYKKDRLSYGTVPIAEDYQVIVEMAKRHRVALLPERLIAYRIYPESVSHTKAEALADASRKIRCGYLSSFPLSADSRTLLHDYFSTDLATESLTAFETAFLEAAAAAGADVSPGGNAFSTAQEIVREYVMRQARFTSALWREMKRSAYCRKLCASPEGFKIMAACLLHHQNPAARQNGVYDAGSEKRRV